MFFVIVVLAVIGLASLLGITAGSVFAALGAVLIVPIILFKLLLLFGFLSVAGGMYRRRARRPRRWQGCWEPERPSRPSGEERFEEWHRMAHAREEVDSWAPEA